MTGSRAIYNWIIVNLKLIFHLRPFIFMHFHNCVSLSYIDFYAETSEDIYIGRDELAGQQRDLF